MGNCANCNVRLGEGSKSHCPSCEESFYMLAVKRPYCPEWIWRIYCALHRLSPWLGREIEWIFASRNPKTLEAVMRRNRSKHD